MLSLEPRLDSVNICWPSPSLITTIAKKIRIPNKADQPLTIKKNYHIAQICAVYIPDVSPSLPPQRKGHLPQYARNKLAEI